MGLANSIDWQDHHLLHDDRVTSCDISECNNFVHVDFVIVHGIAEAMQLESARIVNNYLRSQTKGATYDKF